ncbi:MAG: hypothetical protein QGI88_00855 [SAR202 cluster bacterium]|nr:hypothetical protein [SAR202 cluster bacterium]
MAEQSIDARVTGLESVQQSTLNHLDSIENRLAGIDDRLAGIDVTLARMVGSIAMLQILTVGVILAIIAGAIATILTR